MNREKLRSVGKQEDDVVRSPQMGNPYPDLRPETQRQRDLVAGIDAVVQRTAIDSPEEVMQLKSTWDSIVPKTPNADSPIASISSKMSRFFTKAGVQEKYNFHSLQNKQPSEYGDNYHRAGSAVANIDPGSKADGSDRNNDVIRPYGHFGIMERAIFGRQNRADTSYDGGHLVEHTLMEGQDADEHGNIAPQEGKHFNQAMMRGWERIPETYMHHKHLSFKYSVAVAYTGGNSYSRTGKQLRENGVIPPGIYERLPDEGVDSKVQFDAENIDLLRWIPSEWSVGIFANSTEGNFPEISLPNGSNMARFYEDEKAAEAEHMVPHKIGRQKSGVVSGTIGTLGVVNAGQVKVGGEPVINGKMFSSIPLDGQANAVAPWNAVAAPALPPAQPATILDSEMGASYFLSELRRVRVQKARGRGVLKDATIFENLKNAGIPDNVKILLTKLLKRDRAAIGRFIKAVNNTADTGNGKIDFSTALGKTELKVMQKRRMESLLTDLKFVD